MPTIFSTVLAIATIAIVKSSPVCEDYQHCYKETFNHYGSDILCNGYQSCKEGTILSNHDVICSGPESCHSNTITTSSQLECSGTLSCSNGQLSAETRTGLISCNGRQSCRSGTITKHYTGGDLEDLVRCDAYESCALSQITGHGSGAVCNGKASCKGANINIMPAEPSYEDVVCNGLSSCDKAVIQGSEVLCHGDSSCTSSTIRANYILADNDNAIQSAKIYGQRNEELHIDVTGYNAANKAIINSGESFLVNVNLYGYKSGNLGKLICSDNAICSVSCKSNACKGFTMQCETGSTCNVSPSDCEHVANRGSSVNGVYCPFISYSANELIEYDETDDSEEKDDDMDWNDRADEKERDDEYQALGLLDSHVHGQCHMSEECLGQTMDLDSKVECFGPSSCRSSSINATGELGCDGFESCRGSIQLVSGSLLNCGGPGSCDSSHLIQVYGEKDGVYCSGERSCSNAGAIRVEQGSIQFDSIWSGAHTSIYSGNSGFDDENPASLGFAECWGEESCLNAHYAAWSGGRMGCYSHRACAGANIATKGYVNNKGYVYCRGKEACADAVIDGTRDQSELTEFYCSGTDCAKNAQLKGITSMTVYGTMPGATIDTGNLVSSSPVKIRMYGHQSGRDVTIKTHLKTKADLICKGNACKGLTFDCWDNWSKWGYGCAVSPKVCMEEDSNGEYVEELSVHCPTYIKSKYDGKEYMFLANIKDTIASARQFAAGYNIGDVQVSILAIGFVFFLMCICIKSVKNFSKSNSNSGYVAEETSALLGA